MTIHPLTVAFFAGHDIDVFARHPWAIYPDAEENVLSEDPWMVEIVYCVDGAQQRMVIDENAELIESTDKKRSLAEDL